MAPDGGVSSAQLRALERRLARLEDLQAIRDVLTRYPEAVDRQDLAGLRAIFHPEVEIESRRLVRGLEAALEYFAQFFASNWRATRHYLANQRIELDGDAARAFSYYHQSAVVGEDSIIGWGTYEDELIRVGERWLIVRKVNRVLAMTPILEGWGRGATRALDGSVVKDHQ